MGKLTNALFGGIVLGAVGAAAYSYVKKYQELAPKAPAEGEEGETARSYTSLDMEAAKKAAKATAETIKEGGKKAWNTAKDAGKAVGDVVKGSYGEEIDKAAATYEGVRGKTVDEYNKIKDQVTEKVEAFKAENPEVMENLNKAKETVTGAYSTVADKGKSTIEGIKEKIEDGEVTEAAEEDC